ncbi:MAG TPA: hypothetical protein VMD59_15530 [Acidimicrobiales bacterium]|nr:hypothetical protein [Acidimicrobiales bacterium]
MATRGSDRRRAGGRHAAAACGGGGASPGVASLGSPSTTAASPAGRSSPAGGGPPEGAAVEAGLLKFSQCMRNHGIRDFPDPTSQGLSIKASPGSDLDPNSPQF